MVEKSHTAGQWPAFNEPFRNLRSRVADWLAPASEASTNGNGYSITIELPGVAEKDVNLTVENGLVSLSGEKTTSREEKGETWFFSERQYGSFARSFRLPADADEAAVSADLKDGVLTLTIPRKSAQATKDAKTIKINKS